mgnify:CR=1 FL=1
MFKNKYVNLLFWLLISITISILFRYFQTLDSKSVKFAKQLVIFLVGLRVGVISFIPFILVNNYLKKANNVSINVIRLSILIAIVLVVSFIHDYLF